MSPSHAASSSLAHLKIMLDLLHRHFDLDDSHKILPGAKDGHREGNQYSEAAPDFRNGSACNVVSFSVDRKYQGLAGTWHCCTNFCSHTDLARSQWGTWISPKPKISTIAYVFFFQAGPGPWWEDWSSEMKDLLWWHKFSEAHFSEKHISAANAAGGHC